MQVEETSVLMTSARHLNGSLGLRNAAAFALSYIPRIDLDTYTCLPGVSLVLTFTQGNIWNNNHPLFPPVTRISAVVIRTYPSSSSSMA